MTDGQLAVMKQVAASVTRPSWTVDADPSDREAYRTALEKRNAAMSLANMAADVLVLVAEVERLRMGLREIDDLPEERRDETGVMVKRLLREWH